LPGAIELLLRGRAFKNNLSPPVEEFEFEFLETAIRHDLQDLATRLVTIRCQGIRNEIRTAIRTFLCKRGREVEDKKKEE